ncbi:hypothetical protein Tco_1095421 [Tanacetum coccineum]
MKKLKENVHAIQVGCQNCEGAHLDKDCPLNKEVKSIKEAKYGEFGRPSPFSNGSKYRIGPPGYYTRIDNRPPFGEKKPSLEELMNKHLEESTRRRAEMEEWVKKLQENAEINTQNQRASLKNLETQIKQLTKEFQTKAANEINNSSFDQELVKDPRSRSFDDFDLEIDQLADEYELGIRKKGHMLDDILENYRKVQGDNTYWWHDQKSEKEERREMRVNIEDYDPPRVHVETFEIKKYSFENGQSFICVAKELMDALPLGR